MSIWRVACWLMGHDWIYSLAGYRVCAECDKIERLR